MYTLTHSGLTGRGSGFSGVSLWPLAGMAWSLESGKRWIDDEMRWWDYLVALAGLMVCPAGTSLLVFGHLWPPKQVCSKDGKYQQPLQHHFINGPGEKSWPTADYHGL
jgi:hypothetical protein